MKFGKFVKNTKALSPVVASIILISVVVSVSVASAAWLGGMTTGLIRSAEQVSIIDVEFSDANTVQVMVHNAAGMPSSITNAFINGVELSPFTSILAPQSSSTALTLNASGNNTVLTSGASYTITLITAKGTSIVSAATKYNP
jgi:flagellin-like protein